MYGGSYERLSNLPREVARALGDAVEEFGAAGSGAAVDAATGLPRVVAADPGLASFDLGPEDRWLLLKSDGVHEQVRLRSTGAR